MISLFSFRQAKRGCELSGVVVACATLVACSSPRTESTAVSGYQKPLSSPGTRFAALPPPVQNTIRAQAGAAQIEHITEEKSFGSPVYTIHFTESLVLPPLIVDSRGSVLNPDGTVAVGAGSDFTGVVSGSVANLKIEELPLEVMEAVREQSPGAEIDQAHRELWGQRDIYIITFKEPDKNPKLYLSADGTLLKDAPR